MDAQTDTPTRLPAELHRRELKPLPLRVTQQQYDRLVAARARDGLAIQEHVRRGIDLYLDQLERKALASQPAQPAPAPVERAASGKAKPKTGARAAPRLVRR